jgi:hypothetical protein
VIVWIAPFFYYGRIAEIQLPVPPLREPMRSLRSEREEKGVGLLRSEGQIPAMQDLWVS